MNQKHCPFCQKIKGTSNVKHFYSQIINSALYTKYSSRKSKNFEDFFARKPVKWVIDFKDHLYLQDDDTYLKKFYPSNQQPHKIKALLEYYRFHKNLPRLFFGVLADKVISFFEKKKKYEYRRIKKMLGIPYDQSNQSTQYEKLKEDIQVLNSLSKFTENSTISILNEFFKIQPNDYQLNIDETWLTMQQQELNIPKLNNQQVPQNLQLLKKFVEKHSKDKINLPFHLLKGKTLSNIRNSCNQSPERLFPTQKSTSQQYINSSQEECEYKSQMKSKILTLSQQNKIKTHNKNQIDQNYYINTLGKRNSTHFITSTSSVSPEQIRIEQSRLSQIYLNVQDRQSQSNIFNHAFHFPVQSSNQFTFKNDVSPKKKNQQIIQIYSNNLSKKIKTQPRKSPERQRVFQHTSSQSTKYNNSKTLFQINDKISSFLQLKFRLDNLQNSNNKRKQLNPNSDMNQLQKEEKQQIRGQSYNMVKNKITAKKQIKNK